ncbi:hypothetical protein HPB48_005361 [Haemaphysalis longicornis]|uniref:Ig-like domain-containing protein n=1 Tax=Haemaphysalis longicornis TaxID=44386 RepID=A0A9J6GIA3_HAELO|nr:hypothetical protein HPB48_005361 [Haemaphysalis longicornis]
MSPTNKSFFGGMDVQKAEDDETVELEDTDFRRTEHPGTNIKLLCPGVTGPGSSVTWLYNGSKLRPTWSRVSLGASQEVLFRPLKERDAGLYECTLLGVKVGHLELHDFHCESLRHKGRTEEEARRRHASRVLFMRVLKGKAEAVIFSSVKALSQLLVLVHRVHFFYTSETMRNFVACHKWTTHRVLPRKLGEEAENKHHSLFSLRRRLPEALGMSDTTWVTLVTILVNFSAYLAVVYVNWQQHYKRLEIQEYLAAKRAERQTS